MSTIIGANSVLRGLVLLFWLLSGLVGAATAEDSPMDILNRSEAAMAPPVQYRVQADGTDSVVYQKRMPDGSLAVRTEMLMPIARTMLVLADESYEIYPDTHIAIDTRQIHQAVRGQAKSITSLLGDQARSSLKIRAQFTREGRQYVEIESQVSPEIIKVVAKGLAENARRMLPVAYRYVIDAETNEMVEMTSVSEAGSPLSQMRLSEIKRGIDLPDDLFVLPDNLELKAPKSAVEYVTMISEMVKSRVTRPQVVLPKAEIPRALPPPKPRHLGPVLINPDTGLAIAPTPPGMTKAEFDSAVASRVASIQNAERAALPVEGVGVARLALMVATLCAICGILAALYLQRRKVKVVVQ